MVTTIKGVRERAGEGWQRKRRGEGGTTTGNLHNITNYCSNRRSSADSITIVIQLMLEISSNCARESALATVVVARERCSYVCISECPTDKARERERERKAWPH